MRKQVVVIGVGRFGTTVAQVLHQLAGSGWARETLSELRPLPSHAGLLLLASHGVNGVSIGSVATERGRDAHRR